MSPAKRRARRQRGAARDPGSTAPPQQAATPAADGSYIVPMPNWKWRTFPVYFALSFGLLIGAWVGVLAGYIQADDGNDNPATIVLLLPALLFGFALSRLSTRWLISKRWIKPRRR